MLHKNDVGYVNKLNGKQERFSLRKYAFGLCSVLLGTAFLAFNSGQAVHAETLPPDQTVQQPASDQSNQNENTTKNNGNNTNVPDIPVPANTTQTGTKTITRTINTQIEGQPAQKLTEQSATISRKRSWFEVEHGINHQDDREIFKVIGGDGEIVGVNTHTSGNNVVYYIRDRYTDYGLSENDPKHVTYSKWTRVNDLNNVNTTLTSHWKDWSDWSTGEFGKVTAPSKAGYTVSNPDAAPKVNISSGTNVTFIYTANSHLQIINYIDKDHKVIGTQTISGKTDQTVNITPDVPAGWTIVPNTKVPSSVTFGSNEPTPIEVQIEHKTITVTPQDPKGPEDKLPDNPTMNYPNGVAKKDLNKTVTRTINITNPDSSKQTKTQTVTATRTATVDEVTGKVVSYSNWNGSLEEVQVPKMQGYTAKIDGDTSAITIDDKTPTELTVNISYTPDKQTASVTFYDNTMQSVLSKKDLSGYTDQNSAYNTKDTIKDYLAKGYELVSDDTKGQDIVFDNDATNDQKYTVVLKHKLTGIPDGTKLSDEDLDGKRQSYKFTYDVIYQGNIPDNIKPANIHKVITWTLKADDKGNIGYRDEVTGKVTLSNEWKHDSDSLPAIDTPNITAADGSVYKPTILASKIYDTTIPNWDQESEKRNQNVSIPAIPDMTSTLMLNENEVDPPQLIAGKVGYSGVKFVVTYDSTPATLNITYVDTETGKTVGEQIVNGNVGQKVTQDNLTLPKEYVFVSDNIPDALIKGTNTATVKVIKPEKGDEYVDTPNGNNNSVETTIDYVDYETKQNLASDKIHGSLNTKLDYQDKIKDFEAQGYVLVSKDIPTVNDNKVHRVVLIKPIKQEYDDDQAPITSDHGDTVGTPETQPELPEFAGGMAGIPETEPELPIKNIIVYKDKDGNVITTQDLDGKSGDKVTPKIPEGYVTDVDIPIVTIPQDGTPITITVIKQESSNGDDLIQPELPTYVDKGAKDDKDHQDKASDQPASPTEPDVVPEVTENTSTEPSSVKVLGTTMLDNKVVANKPSVSAGKRKVMPKRAARAKGLPQTGAKTDVLAVVAGALVSSLSLLGLANRKKRN